MLFLALRHSESHENSPSKQSIHSHVRTGGLQVGLLGDASTNASLTLRLSMSVICAAITICWAHGVLNATRTPLFHSLLCSCDIFRRGESYLLNPATAYHQSRPWPDLFTHGTISFSVQPSSSEYVLDHVVSMVESRSGASLKRTTPPRVKDEPHTEVLRSNFARPRSVQKS